MSNNQLEPGKVIMIMKTKVIKILKPSTKLEGSSHPKAQIVLKHLIFLLYKKICNVHH
jgi:hypothetical protein